MNNKIKVRNRRNAEDERWMTRKAYEIVKNDFIIIDGVQQEASVIPNVQAPQNEGAAQDATGEIKVRNKPGPKPKLVTNEA